MLAAHQLLCIHSVLYCQQVWAPRKLSSTAALVFELQWLKQGSEFIKWPMQLSWESPRDKNQYDTKHSTKVSSMKKCISSFFLEGGMDYWTNSQTTTFWFSIGLLHFKRRGSHCAPWTHPFEHPSDRLPSLSHLYNSFTSRKEVKKIDHGSSSGLLIPILPSRGPQCHRHVLHCNYNVWPSQKTKASLAIHC